MFDAAIARGSRNKKGKLAAAVNAQGRIIHFSGQSVLAVATDWIVRIESFERLRAARALCHIEQRYELIKRASGNGILEVMN